MTTHLCKTISLLVALCVAAAGMPRLGLANDSRLTRGMASSDAAAAPASPAPGPVPSREPDILRFAVAYAHSQPDTTTEEFEFPEEEEKHLARDIAVWVIVSAFVAYFIVKVFIEEDTNEPDQPSGGKTIPGN